MAWAGHGRLRFAVALAYFLAGSSGLPAGAATFFGPGHEMLGDVLWVTSAVMLALPWVWASGWKGTLAALVLDAVPPLGCFGWLSPLTAAGALYPGTGLGGLALLLGLCAGMAERKWPIIGSLIALALLVNLVFLSAHRPSPPTRWIGVDTQVGPVSGNIVEAAMQRSAWLAQVRNAARDARVVVLPETLAGPWLPGTAAQIRSAILPGQMWLVGATAWVDNRRADVLMKVSRRAEQERPLFVSPFPVPVSMWTPWADGGYRAAWWEPVRRVAGVHVWAAICYDQLLPWVWIEGLVQSPAVVLAVSNDWWARGTGAAEIQRATTWAWARLMDTAVVRAENR